MNRDAAEKLIKSTFEQPFDEERYTYFVRELLNHLDDSKTFTHAGAYIPDAFKPHVRSFRRLGIYTDPDGQDIDILIVYLQKDTALDRARTMQRNFVAHHLKNRDKEAALVAYASPDLQDWRFSFVRLEYQLQVDEETGKVKLDEALTPSRRYSFLVGANEPNHTAQQQLISILADDAHDPPLDTLEEAFDIEVVTNQFFEDYKERFLELVEAIDQLVASQPKVAIIFSEDGLTTANFAKRLMGQIVFLYFLQKKGWLGARNGQPGPKDFLRQLYEKKWSPFKNFFNEILEPLFYDALAVEHPDNYFEPLDCKIPFLNGGLFEPPQEYNRQTNPLPLPNTIFGNIFDTFDLYNFTVREDEPLEKEVAVDPEMLGKVFERLLEVQDRKSKGAFYTPREIVHYMCQESLINYLDTALNIRPDPLAKVEPVQGDMFAAPKAQQKTMTALKYDPIVPKEAIEFLIRQGEFTQEYDRAKQAGTKSYTYKLPPSVRLHAQKIDQALADVKICDPAIGSGAFPVGMMQEIVRARQVLSTYLSKEDTNRSVYDFKRHAIQNSLYGVDIDPGAVDIAKLRLWLSLVVDEDDFSQVNPLPNLDYKIVTGNSLLNYPYERRGLDNLEALKDQFFNENDPEKKNFYRQKIDRELNEIFKNTKKSLGYQVTVDFKINFSEVFREKRGFDIVIGNPPYVRMELFKELKPFFKGAYPKVYTGRADLYVYFYNRGLEILREMGNLALITSNKFMRAKYGEKLRNLLATETTLKVVVDFGDLPVFEATSYPSIVITTKTHPPKYSNVTALTVETVEQIQRISHVITKEAWSLPQETAFAVDGWKLESPEVLKLLEKLCQSGTSLGEYVNGRFYYGIKTGYNQAFVIDQTIRDHLISKHPSSNEVIQPWLRGRDVKKWHVDYAGLHVIFMPHGVNIEKYPAINDYLQQFKEKLENRATSHLHPWYEMQQPQMGCYLEYEKPKIVYPDISKHPAFAYDENGKYITNTLYVIPTTEKFLMGVLNSNVIDFFYSHISSQVREDYLRFIAQYVSQIPTISENQKQAITIFVNRIISMKEADPNADVSTLEMEINHLVYHLFDLTPEDIALVEQSVDRPTPPAKLAEQELPTEPTTKPKPLPKLAPVESQVQKPFTPTDYGLYQCGECGKAVVGFDKQNHSNDLHDGKDVTWIKMRKG